VVWLVGNALASINVANPVTIRYDSVYLTCSKKLTVSQLSLPHGTNEKKLKEKLKINWTMTDDRL